MYVLKHKSKYKSYPTIFFLPPPPIFTGGSVDEEISGVWEFGAIFKLVSPLTRRKFRLGSSSKKAFVWVCWWLCLQMEQEQLPPWPKYFGTSCSVPHWKPEEKVILVLKFGFRRVNDQQGSLQFIATCSRCDQQYRWEVLRMERKFQVGEERAGDEDPRHWGSSLKLASLCL